MTAQNSSSGGAGKSFKNMPEGAFNAALRAAMNDKKSDLKLTNEEVKNFEQAMKKPEFMDLMKEYMDDISDPKYRAEQEKYLRELESKNEIPKDKELLKPKPGFCVKSKLEDEDQSKSTKVFINVCYAEGVEKASSRQVEQGGKKGVSWSIPFSLGPMRQEKDKKGVPAPTFDFAVHTDTVAMAKLDARFRKMVVELAMENIENRAKEIMKGKPFKICRTYKVLKGVTCMGTTPAIQTIGKRAPAPKKHPSAPAKKGTTKKRAVKAAPLKKERPLHEPKYTVTERGKHKVAEFVDGTSALPASLVVRVHLDKLNSARGVNLDVSEKRIKVDYDKKGVVYHLDATLPYAVESSKGTAKFDKAQKMLIVTVPVKAPPRKVTKPPLSTLVKEVETVTLRETNKTDTTPTPAPVSAPDPVAAKEPETASIDPDILAAMKAAKLPFPAPPAAEEKDASSEANVSSEPAPDPEGEFAGDAFISASAFSGRKEGYYFGKGAQGLGYYADVASSSTDRVDAKPVSAEQISDPKDIAEKNISATDQKNDVVSAAKDSDASTDAPSSAFSSLHLRNENMFELD